MQPLLELKRLSVRYGAICALEGLSLQVPERSIITLLGGNGAGKTSTLRCISGLLRSSAGSIHFAGTDITRLPPHEIVRLGLCHVPEGRLVFPNLSVEENLAMGAYLDRDRARIARNRDYVLSLFPRLGERLSQSSGTLSGGEQQMLAISRALMGNPRLLMLDEPSLGIAPRLVTSIFQKIRSINEEHGVSILLVEQNARLALELSSEAFVLETGRVAIHGPSRELKDDPRLLAAYLGA